MKFIFPTLADIIDAEMESGKNYPDYKSKDIDYWVDLFRQPLTPELLVYSLEESTVPPIFEGWEQSEAEPTLFKYPEYKIMLSKIESDQTDSGYKWGFFDEATKAYSDLYMVTFDDLVNQLKCRDIMVIIHEVWFKQFEHYNYFREL